MQKASEKNSIHKAQSSSNFTQQTEEKNLNLFQLYP